MHLHVYLITYFNKAKTFSGYAIISSTGPREALELLENTGKYSLTEGYRIIHLREIGCLGCSQIEIIYEGVSPDGLSAYEIAVRHGYKGTEEEWLATLKGDKGDKGDTGASAYEIAVRNGYKGSESLFIYDLLYGKGTSYLYCVKNLTELYSLPKIHGYMVYVEDLNKYYTYNQDSTGEYLWLEASLGGEGVSDNVLTILRALLILIAKMRNAFLYGMNSYDGTDTAMSRVVDEYDTTIDEEPFWAIEESDLSLIEDISISADSGLTPVTGINDTTLDGRITITGKSIYTVDSSVESITDPKLVLYLTTSNLNIVLNLVRNESNLALDLSKLTVNSATSYNTMIIISRKYQTYGDNYIWISIDDAVSGTKIAEGYFNNYTLTTTKSTIDLGYTLKSVEFTDLVLNKCTLYSKYQDFSRETIPSKPSDETYKYKVAHITIRAVENTTQLEKAKETIQEHELVWSEATSELYIKSNSELIKIGSNTNTTTGMNETLILAMLLEAGIPITKNSDGTYSMGAYSSISFKNDITGKNYSVYVDNYGELIAEEVTTDNDMTSLIASYYDANNNNVISVGSSARGFASRYFSRSNNGASTDNLKLNSDRVRIGSVYVPKSTDTVHGCSHCFVELENTSDLDFPLGGCYLYLVYTKLVNGNDIPLLGMEKLALKGKIPAGGTFLIRGKKYDTTANTFITVDTFDLEWYIDNNTTYYNDTVSANDYELIDLTNLSTTNPFAFALVYYDSNMNGKEGTILDNIGIATDLVSGALDATTYYGGFIDAMILLKGSTNTITGNWESTNGTAFSLASNSITKNTFELDPANLAYRALCKYDSNTVRWKKTADQQSIDLSNPYISFPNSDDKYPVTMFTPKASYEDKNVCTDKTKLDLTKPNMVTVAFGKNIHTTRCFNWISAGVFNEYVWVRTKGSDTWSKLFSSYTTASTANTLETTVPYRVEFSVDVNNTIYARMNGIFPGSGTYYTAHKCILLILDTAPSSTIEYEYIVGRADINGNPDTDHCSDIMYFTIYPESYKPLIYQITDLQGFHWIEYQAWAAAAKVVNDKITTDMGTNNSNLIIPILINTGDMTLNGTRVNEWLDYYNAGKCLFNHLELMNVVGNNDLCQSSGTNPHEVLGTGDDDGKSNPYYFHLFYCYEVETTSATVSYDSEYSITGTSTGTASVDMTPIINNVYVPSLYMFGNDTYLYLMLNSEITDNTCVDLFKTGTDDSFINIYTGYTVTTTLAFNTWGNPSWTPIYDKIYAMINNHKSTTIVAACHEMPFTVITDDNILASGDATEDETYDGVNTSKKPCALSRNHDGSSNKLGLVGSHMNLISVTDLGKGTYWLSRLLEYFGITLCIGGHKHTYAVTFPIRENYLYGSGKKSITDGGMNMPYTLLYDTYSSKSYTSADDVKDLSKFPIIDVDTTVKTLASSDNYFQPITNNHSDSNESSRNKVTYFMCLATGYKQSSNKELPSPYQDFSKIVPLKSGSNASAELLYPMFAIISADKKVLLLRITNIMNSAGKFTLLSYGKGTPALLYIAETNANIYGVWGDTKSYVI